VLSFLCVFNCASIYVKIQAKVYFKEQFEDGWQDRWVESTTWKDASQMGKWEHTAGKWYGDENDKGIQTSQVLIASVFFSFLVYCHLRIQFFSFFSKNSQVLNLYPPPPPTSLLQPLLYLGRKALWS
jgi:hypothetical protein